MHLRDISEDTVLFPWKQATPFPAVESAIAVAIALGLGAAFGHTSAGSIAAGAAFTVGFAVFHEALSSTLFSMAVLTLGIASATLVGSLGAQHTPVVFLLCVVAAVNYGLLAGISNTTGWVGQQCGVFVVVSSYFSSGVHYAVGRSGMVLAGGALQMAVYAATKWLRQPRSSTATSRSATGPRLSFARRLGRRTAALWRAFRKELHWTGDTTSYILRLLATLGISTAAYRLLHWQNGYWAPMTALLVLKPKWANTLSRGVARLTGTLVGAALCALLALYPAFHHWVYFLLIVFTGWACFALQAVNYALFSCVLTVYTVFLFAFGGFSERSAADLRLINTLLGGCVALAVDFTSRCLKQYWDKPQPAG